MYKITNPEKFRENVHEKFRLLIDDGDEKKALNLEIGIFNYVIKEATIRKIVKKWENPPFTQLYIDHFRSIFINLKDEELLEQLRKNEITPQNVAFMTHQELRPKQWSGLIEKKIKRDASKFTNNIQASTDMFVCKKCKSRKCVTYELQTRSADEPATIFITCLDCGKQFKN